jgi:hypothetical protein
MHGDHFDRIASRELNRDLTILTTPHAARRLTKRGFREPVAMRTWSDRTLTKNGAALTITSLPGRHALGAAAKVLPPVMGTMLEYRAAQNQRPPLRIYVSGETFPWNRI